MARPLLQIRFSGTDPMGVMDARERASCSKNQYKRCKGFGLRSVRAPM